MRMRRLEADLDKVGSYNALRVGELLLCYRYT